MARRPGCREENAWPMAVTWFDQGLLGVDNDFRLSIKIHGKNFLLLTHFVGPRPVSTLML